MHLAYSVHRLSAGGAQRQAVELALRLAQEDAITVSLLHYGKDDFFAERLREGRVNVVHLARTGRLDWRFPLSVRRWVLEARPDLIHSFLLGPIFWASLALSTIPGRRRPVHVAGERSEFARLPPMERRIKQLLYRRCAAITANSRLSAEQVRRLPGVRSERVHFLPNAIDFQAWQSLASQPAGIALDAGRRNLAVVGRLAPAKNQRAVVQALRGLGPAARGWSVWLIGDASTHPEYAAALEAEIREAGLVDSVHLLGPRKNVASILRAMTALLLPSRHEGFPNVVLEAMALGVPVVAAPVGEVPNLVTDGATGMLLDDATPASIAAALNTVSAMTEAELAALGARGREHVREHYALGPVAARHRAFYEACLGRARSTPHGAPT